MDTLHSLRHFAEAVRVGSLSAAAREIGISPATVSRSIDSLERELGFSLLAKTSRQLALTSISHVVFAHALQMSNLVRLCNKRVKRRTICVCF